MACNLACLRGTHSWKIKYAVLVYKGFVIDFSVIKLLVTFISVFNQLDAQNLFHNKFYFMPLHVSSTCARNM